MPTGKRSPTSARRSTSRWTRSRSARTSSGTIGRMAFCLRRPSRLCQIRRPPQLRQRPTPRLHPPSPTPTPSQPRPRSPSPQTAHRPRVPAASRPLSPRDLASPRRPQASLPTAHQTRQRYTHLWTTSSAALSRAPPERQRRKTRARRRARRTRTSSSSSSTRACRPRRRWRGCPGSRLGRSGPGARGFFDRTGGTALICTSPRSSSWDRQPASDRAYRRRPLRSCFHRRSGGTLRRASENRTGSIGVRRGFSAGWLGHSTARHKQASKAATTARLDGARRVPLVAGLWKISGTWMHYGISSVV
ncbi:hypothetical protein B5807_02518 [Epicoccum nigrum]|uniref:Uncharacterized protein n=1 Tax=Epicoccum nigrum TaxID=105696 RepID=A0A1Y2MCC5_EPING|nr:hypothetical protein B5807_02518 [Epicoccum nigrum]